MVNVIFLIPSVEMQAHVWIIYVFRCACGNFDIYLSLSSNFFII